MPPRLVKSTRQVADSIEHGGSEVVDDVVDAAEAARDLSRDDDQRDGADRQVDVEDPVPGELLDEDAAEQRADDARDAEDRAEEPLVATAFARRDDVADDRLRTDHQAAAAETLDGPERDQLGQGLAEPREGRAAQEDDDRRLEEELAPVLVAELAPQRRRDGRGEQVGDDDPGEVRRAVEVGDDRRQRGRDDRLVERRQEHPEHQRADDDQHAAVAEAGDGELRPMVRSTSQSSFVADLDVAS